MNEQLKALLESLELSEETATSIQTILSEAFAAAKEEGKAEGKEEGKAEAKAESDKDAEELKESHELEVAFLKEKANEYGEHLKEKANAYGESIKESVSVKMKEYAEFAVEEFIAENKERFVETEEYARIKSAFDYIKEAFEKNGFNVQEDAQVVELQESLQDSTAKYESLFEDLSAAKEELNNLNRTLILERAVADLADTQKEKVNELLETVSFDSIEEYKDGVAMIVEQAKTVAAPAQIDLLDNKQQEVLTEQTKPKKEVDSGIARFMKNGLL